MSRLSNFVSIRDSFFTAKLNSKDRDYYSAMHDFDEFLLTSNDNDK